MGTIKDRNGMNLTEAEDIKRWQEYTEELYKKDLHNSDNNDGVLSHQSQTFWNVMLSILHRVMCVFPCYSHNSSHFFFPRVHKSVLDI